MDAALYWKAAVAGLVEGATEFLPVSSTGHLILVGDLLDFEGPTAKTFEIFIQLGAILAVVWFYRRFLLEVALHWMKSPTERRFLWNLVIAFLPAAVVGLLVHDWLKAHLFNPLSVAVALVVGGVAILAIERWHPRARIETVAEMPPRTAFEIGLAQVLSLWPGTSRSGATIMGAMCFGVSRVAATEFSFFLAIPTMFAATLYDLYKSRGVLAAGDAPVFAIGFVVSFVSALIVVKGLLRYVSSHDFRAFGWYRIVLGLIVLGYFWLTSGLTTGI
ncbi:MAG TPA: undecaprenyl-diphosphate phosphatase [Longimicrobiales bacterium]|nr:undecaprenyl-diphosphate phosphatase [Longimicrobiales bacterium]